MRSVISSLVHLIFSFLFSIKVDPNKYKGIFNGFSITLKEDGVRGLAKGWAPTFIGYSLQGLCKFGFYEVFKVLYSNMLGEVCDLILEWKVLSFYLYVYLFIWPCQGQVDILWPAI